MGTIQEEGSSMVEIMHLVYPIMAYQAIHPKLCQVLTHKNFIF
jgi:hypothetical protein